MNVSTKHVISIWMQVKKSYLLKPHKKGLDPHVHSSDLWYWKTTLNFKPSAPTEHMNN